MPLPEGGEPTMKELFPAMRKARSSPGMITALYILIFSAWIMFSDRLLTAMVSDTDMLTNLQTLKGWLFVLGTGWLLHHLFASLKQAYEDKLSVFAGLFEQSAFPMLLIDPATAAIMHANAAAAAFYGHAAGELKGMPLGRIDTDPEPVIREHMAQILDGSRNVFLLDHMAAGGETRKVRISASLVRINGHPFISTLIEDVTEGARKDAEIRRLGRQLSGFLDGTPTPACLLDAQGRLLMANRALERVAGAEAAELSGRPLPAIFPGAPEEATARSVADVLAGGPAVEAENALEVMGTRHVFKSVVFPVTGDAGRVDFVGVVAMDVTREKQAEAALLEAKERAEAADRAKSVFLANMSHELRTPLSGVSGMLQLLAASRLDAEQQDYVAAAEDSCRSLTRLLADILELSRIEAGLEQPEESTFAPRALAADMAALFARPAHEAGLDLEVSVDPATPELLAGDAGKIRQILLNLLGNAIKFTQRGSVQADILPLLGHARPRLLLSVADTGIGIPDDRLGDLFQPFAQVERTFTRSFQGAGLGLSIVRRLAIMLEGEVCVSSEPGQGTTFLVSLPLRLPSEAEAAARPAVSAQPSLSGPPPAAPDRDAAAGRGRVLVAEDDMINQMALNHVLTRAGWTVDCAGNGQEAVELFRGGPFDAVIMDIQMPRMNGMEATQAIRRLESGASRRTPVIAVSAYALPGERDEIIRSGIDAHLAKPVDFDQLIGLIDSMRTSVPAGAG